MKQSKQQLREAIGEELPEWRGFTHHFIAKKLNQVIENRKKKDLGKHSHFQRSDNQFSNANKSTTVTKAHILSANLLSNCDMEEGSLSQFDQSMVMEESFPHKLAKDGPSSRHTDLKKKQMQSKSHACDCCLNEHMKT